jgi:uncharacterized pyridoxamine 5'-phosphate oxidase family protein
MFSIVMIIVNDVKKLYLFRNSLMHAYKQIIVNNNDICIAMMEGAGHIWSDEKFFTIVVWEL